MVSQQPGEEAPEEEKIPVPTRKRPFSLSVGFLLSLFMLGFLVYRLISVDGVKPQEIPYSQFKYDLTQGQVLNVLVGETSISGQLRDGTEFTTVRVEDAELTQTAWH
jgi:hypothetical protein